MCLPIARPAPSAFHDGVLLPALFAVSSALLGGAQMIVHSKAVRAHAAGQSMVKRTPSTSRRSAVVAFASTALMNSSFSQKNPSVQK